MTDTLIPPVTPTTTSLTSADRWDHIVARCGFERLKHRVNPGLYSVGNPTAQSPVLVSANYTLSFDALRSSLEGIDAYILVLNTGGINVWCAAGKGTFGTRQIVRRVKMVCLDEVVSHRKLIIPQLAAPGVAAHEVKQGTGFKVEYGPVRARDLPEYLRTGKATAEMRRVGFNLLDRMVLIPVEVHNYFWFLVIGMVVGWLLGGWLWAGAAAVSVLAGTALFPMFLPWLPTRDFSTKGWLLGALAALPFALLEMQNHTGTGVRLLHALPLMLTLPALCSYISLNFTGSTPFTSRSGVKREIATYIPIMAALGGVGLVMAVVLRLMQVLR